MFFNTCSGGSLRQKKGTAAGEEGGWCRAAEQQWRKNEEEDIRHKPCFEEKLAAGRNEPQLRRRVKGANKTAQHTHHPPTHHPSPSLAYGQQYLVVPALERHHEALRHRRQVGDGVHHPEAHVARVARDEPDALDPRHVGHVVQQLGERVPGAHVPAVGVHVLSQQGHLGGGEEEEKEEQEERRKNKG